MSNVSGGISGRFSSRGNLVLQVVTGVSLAIFVLNYLMTSYKSGQETWGRGQVADIQVKSQQLAVQAKDAVGGDQDAFAKFKVTRSAIEDDVTSL